MRYALLTLLLAAGPGGFTVTPGFVVTPGELEFVPAPPPKIVKKMAQPVWYANGWHKVYPGERLLPGNHWHVCHRCGYSVQHGASNFGNGSAHTCPCGLAHFIQSDYPIVHRQ
jgi:hypothetical protein